MTAAPTRAVRRPSLGWLLGAAAALAMLWISWSHVRRGIWVDLDVYRAGGAAVRSGESLYDVRIKDLPFTYPPFAALLFVPAAVVSEHVARWGMTIVTMSAMVAVLEVVRRRLGLSRLDAVPLASGRLRPRAGVPHPAARAGQRPPPAAGGPGLPRGATEVPGAADRYRDRDQS